MELPLLKRNTQHNLYNESSARNIIHPVQALGSRRCGSFEVFQLSRITNVSPSSNCKAVTLVLLMLLASLRITATIIGVNKASEP